jgi:hypothetical protein
MSLHKEISFETEICEHLAANGWLYAEGDAAGCGGSDGWHHYGVSHGGRLEVVIDSETSFIFAESSNFDSYAHFSPGPFLNLRDRAGREWVCMASSLADPHNLLSPSRTACIPVDEASCDFG